MFNHFDENGNAVMVDVGEKSHTERIAVAQGKIFVSSEIMKGIQKGTLKKGDVLGVARVAGIMGVKHTWELIPMCHQIMLTKCTIDFKLDTESNFITVKCTVKCCGQTGVEMEALTGVQIALLTIYDMCKAVDKGMHMEDIHLVQKSGGKSGDFYYEG